MGKLKDLGMSISNSFNYIKNMFHEDDNIDYLDNAQIAKKLMEENPGMTLEEIMHILDEGAESPKTADNKGRGKKVANKIELTGQKTLGEYVKKQKETAKEELDRGDK